MGSRVLTGLRQYLFLPRAALRAVPCAPSAGSPVGAEVPPCSVATLVERQGHKAKFSISSWND